MEGAVIILLSLSLAVGILILVTVIMHFGQWKRANRQGKLPEQHSVSLPSIHQAAVKPLSNIEKKYLQLFLEGKTTEEISAVMHVEPSSVYTMKYRIRKKFPEDYPLEF